MHPLSKSFHSTTSTQRNPSQALCCSPCPCLECRWEWRPSVSSIFISSSSLPPFPPLLLTHKKQFLHSSFWKHAPSLSYLMFPSHTVVIKVKRAGSIRQRTDSPVACHASNCEFITDGADQYGTLDSTHSRMIWSLSYWNFFYGGGLDTSTHVWRWRDLTHI